MSEARSRTNKLGQRRLSIGFLMAVVFLIAADFGLVRAFRDSGFAATLIALIPPVNLLLLALPSLRKSNRSRPFWLRFEIAGWIGVLVTVALFSSMDRRKLFAPIIWLAEQNYVEDQSYAQYALIITAIIAMFSMPQLLITMFLAWLTSRYRVSIYLRESKEIKS